METRKTGAAGAAAAAPAAGEVLVLARLTVAVDQVAAALRGGSIDREAANRRYDGLTDRLEEFKVYLVREQQEELAREADDLIWQVASEVEEMYRYDDIDGREAFIGTQIAAAQEGR